jgi:hypothetical protein
LMSPGLDMSDPLVAVPRQKLQHECESVIYAHDTVGTM